MEDFSMDIVRTIEGFYDTIEDDARIGVTHISLYMALLYKESMNKGNGSFLIARDDIMKLSKISSRQTYNRCINELCNYGYIRYSPSSNPLTGSTIYLEQLKKQ